MATIPPIPRIFGGGKTLDRVQAKIANALSGLQNTVSWVLVGQNGGPAFQNSWVNFDANGKPNGRDARFRIDEIGYVVISGQIKSGTVGTAAFTLPTGYRPGRLIHFPCTSNAAFGSIQVSTTGDVTPEVGSNAYFTLDTIRFLPEL